MIEKFQARRKELKGKLTELCINAYEEFCKSPQAKKIRDSSPGEARLLNRDPRENRMWHHSFDPHSQIPQVPLAELNAQPQVH